MINTLKPIKDKQYLLNKFSELKLNNAQDPKTLLENIFSLKISGKEDLNITGTINKLKMNRCSWFTPSYTRSAVNASIIIFLKSLKENFKNGFRDDGSLNVTGFFKFLNDNLGATDANQIISNIKYSYLEEVKLSEGFAMIVFGSDYAVATSLIENNTVNGTWITKQMDQLTTNDGIKNKIIRKHYTEEEIVHAKKLSENYFTKTIIPKITQMPDEEKKAATISQIIYLSRMINMSARHLSEHNLGYQVLDEMAANIFTKLQITDNNERIHFINSLIFINFHRNCGMIAKGVAKAPLMLLWLSLPLIAETGMLIAGVSSFRVLGVGLGILGIIGALIEGGSDMLNYGSYYRELDKSINCGDRLSSSTDTAIRLEEALYNQVSNDKKKIIAKAIPDNKVLEKRYCSGESNTANLTVNVLYDTSSFKQLQENLKPMNNDTFLKNLMTKLG